MSNLRHQANELLYARMQVFLGDWGYIEDYTMHFDDACAVIHGYQELLRRIVKTFDDRDPYQYGELVGKLSGLIDEARSSIPEEQPNE
jgi:hypothetical protein